jgi:hypothetical protein
MPGARNQWGQTRLIFGFVPFVLGVPDQSSLTPLILAALHPGYATTRRTCRSASQARSGFMQGHRGLDPLLQPLRASMQAKKTGPEGPVLCSDQKNRLELVLHTNGKDVNLGVIDKLKFIHRITNLECE